MELESLIKRHLNFSALSSGGWQSINCKCCADYKPRGAFKFNNDSIYYNCFNCGAKAVYKDNERLSRNMKEILIAFSIPDKEIEKCISLSFFKEKKIATSTEPIKKKHLELPTIEAPLPIQSVLISTENSQWCEVAREYLKGRGISSTDVPFYVSDNEKWIGRVIIPYIFREKIIYWQARSMDELITPRYKNPSIMKENIFFNMDELYRYTDDPLFVTEGPLDALSIGKNAIALLGSTLSEFQEQELKKASSKRKIIFVIDKNSNGYKLGQKVLKQGWAISILPDNVDDANDSLVKYGHLWTVSYLMSSAKSGFAGKLLIEMFCKV